MFIHILLIKARGIFFTITLKKNIFYDLETRKVISHEAQSLNTCYLNSKKRRLQPYIFNKSRLSLCCKKATHKEKPANVPHVTFYRAYLKVSKFDKNSKKSCYSLGDQDYFYARSLKFVIGKTLIIR